MTSFNGRKSLFSFFVVLSSLLFLASCGTQTLTQNPNPVVDVGPKGFDPLGVAGTQVGIVISAKEGDQAVAYVTGGTSRLTALEVLNLTTFNLIIADFGPSLGAAVCSIEGVGQPANNCFGDAQGRSWGLFVLEQGASAWVPAQTGISAQTVEDGDIIGLAWTGYDPVTYANLRDPGPITAATVFKR